MGYLEELRKRGCEANPFFRLMGIDPVSFGQGEAELSMQVRPDMLNGAGWLQGGIFTALCDEAMALALFTTLEDDTRIATISESTSFLQGVRDGLVVARGKVIRKGRQVAFTDGFVSDEGGMTLSQTQASFMILPRR